MHQNNIFVVTDLSFILKNYSRNCINNRSDIFILKS